MSRDNPFDGLPLDREKREESYEPGDLGYDYKLLERIVDRYISKSYWGKAFQVYVYKELLPLVESIEDPDDFLSALVHSLSYKATKKHHFRESYQLVFNVVRELYDNGFDEFSVDLTPLESMPDHICRWYKGTEERPIHLNYTVPTNPDNDYDVRWAGKGVEHVVATVSGSTEWGANSCKNSTFTFERHVERLGWDSKDCTFHLPNVSNHKWGQDKWYHQNPLTLSYGENQYCTIWIQEHFWENGNKILIPDEDGEWQEVKP